MPTPGKTALWLVPCATDRRYLAAVIADLSRRCGGPRFEPHVTLLTADGLEVGAVAAAARRAAHRFGPFTVSAAGIGGSAAYFQALYLQLRDPGAIARLRRRLGAELGLDAGSAPRPHLSLAYQHLPPARRGELASAMRLKASYRLDALALVAPGRSGTWRPVAGWRVVERIPLGA